MSGVGGAIPRQRLVNIQILRGVAALLVVVTHAIDMSESVAGDWGIAAFGHVENFGAFGVDLFFVISGFVMAYSVVGRSGIPAARDFIVRRWIRIAPPYLIVGAAMIPLNLAHGVPVSLQSVLNLVLFVPFFDHRRFTPPPLDVGWTLSFEFTFYVVVAAAVVCGVARRVVVVAPLLGLAVLIGIAVPEGPFLLQWVTNPMLLEFAFGILVFELWQRSVLQRLRVLWIVLSAVALAVLAVEVVVGYPPISESPFIVSGQLSGTRVLLWGVPAAVVFAAVVAVREPFASRGERAWRGLGDVSYSVYLVHVPAILVVGAMLKQIPGVPGPVALVGGAFAGVAAGLLFYRLVERRLTTRLDGAYRQRVAAGGRPRRTARGRRGI